MAPEKMEVLAVQALEVEGITGTKWQHSEMEESTWSVAKHVSAEVDAKWSTDLRVNSTKRDSRSKSRHGGSRAFYLPCGKRSR
jgi:hypothetical protein